MLKYTVAIESGAICKTYVIFADNVNAAVTTANRFFVDEVSTERALNASVTGVKTEPLSVTYMDQDGGLKNASFAKWNDLLLFAKRCKQKGNMFQFHALSKEQRFAFDSDNRSFKNV